MLSIVDLKKELGENIYIYPVHPESIKSNSIDLHVSQFAWSLETKNPIVEDGYIVIQPHDTALIYTEESIYVSNKIAGSYHSKVTLVAEGLGHIGTTLDAQYIGNSIITVHNHSNNEIRLKIGREFVTLQFYYLASPDYENAPSHDNEPGHPRMLNGFNGVEDYIEWRDKNTWNTKKKALYLKMVESDEYKKCKAEYEIELNKFNKKLIRGRIKKYFTIFLITAIVCILVCIPTYYLELGKVNTIMQSITEKIIFPLILTIVTSLIVVDLKNK